MYLRSFKFEWLPFFQWICYSPSADKSCLSLFMIWSLFGHDFLTKASRVKTLFSQPFRIWSSVVSYFRAHCEGKKRILILYLNLLKVFIFQRSLNLKISFLKSKAQVMELICYTKENINMRLKKVLAPIIDTIITLARLCLPFRGHRDDSKYHPKVGEYSTGGVSNFLEFLQFRIRGGDKC